MNTPNKDFILDNVGMYSAKELADFIRQGIVTYDELCNDTVGQFDANKRKEVKKLLDADKKPKSPTVTVSPPVPTPQPGTEEETDTTMTAEDLAEKIKDLLPDGMYKAIADGLTNKDFTRKMLLDMINDDNNILPSKVVKKLMDNKLLTEGELNKIVDKKFVKYLSTKTSPESFPTPQPVNRINKLSTEVYFWGIPSSGKSCALGAIMSVANTGNVAKTMVKDNDCQGYGYMTRLSELFNTKDKVCNLPAGTSIYSTYEMGFDLVDEQGLSHPITCVDLAGELVRCMFKHDAKENMSKDEKGALDTLTNLLIDKRSGNRKMHFFVIEYGAEERLYEGLSQNAYLEAALRYIERTKIFKKETDAIYLIITKADKAKAASDKQLEDILRRYLSDNYYKGFYNGLVKICKDSEINRGEVEIIPFSIGAVCFRDYCLFDAKRAENIVRILLRRTKGFKSGKKAKIFNGMKS